MTARHVTDATMRVRDALYEGLLLRRGMVLTEEVARERANNLSTAVIEVLRELAEIRRATDEPPPVREPVNFDDPLIR